MKIALIGYGYWGRNLARNLNQLGVLHTICDVDPRSREQANSTYPKVRSTGNYNSVLTDSKIDGVVIATPSTLHYEQAKAALLHNKDVFVEKPFTTRTEEAEELISLSIAKHRVLMVGHLMIYHPAIQLLKKCIQDDGLGDIYYLYSTRVNLGQVRQGTDVLWQLAPHDISIFIYLLDKIPSIVSAQGFSYIQPDMADVAFVTLTFNGVVAHMQVSWLDPHKIRQLTVVGSHKMAVFDDTARDNQLCIYDRSVEKHDLSIRSGIASYPQLEQVEVLAIECADFVDCIETRSQPLSSAPLGLKVVSVLESITRIMSGRPK